RNVTGVQTCALPISPDLYRDNRLAAGDERPVERGIDRERETEHAADHSSEQGENPNGTHAGAESGVDQVIWRRGIGGDLPKTCEIGRASCRESEEGG